MLLDVRPLLRRDFRLLFVGQLVSIFGTMMTSVAVPYQVWTATHSTILVGLLSVAQLVPLVATALVGGALADAMDRRRLLLASEIVLALVSGLLAVNALMASPSLLLVFVLSALSSAVSGFHRPALDALAPRLVPPDEIPAQNALQGVRGTLGMVGGPALGGLAIATMGLPATYLIDAATFAVSLLAVLAIRSMGPPGGEDGPRVGLASIREGLRYAASRQEILGMYAVDFVAMLFGMPIALLPAIADRFGGAAALGWLTAAPAAGAFLVTLVSGFATKVTRHGRAIVLAAGAWGIAIVAFGLSRALVPSLAFLAVAGAADMVSGLFRMRISNETIPDTVRGRMAGLDIVAYISGPFLGNAEAGLVAGAFGVTFSVVSGGVLCVLGVAAAALFLPRFRRYRHREGASALEERSA